MTSKKNSVTIKAHAARYLAEGMLAAVSKDNVTPTICGAHIRVEKGELVGVSTDRYRVHRVVLDVDGKSKPHEFILPREALQWLEKNAGAYSRRRSGPYEPVVTFTTHLPAEGAPASDTGTVEITVQRSVSLPDRIAYVGPLTKGTFPTVERLFAVARDADEVPGRLRLNLDFVGSVQHLNADRGSAPLIRFTASDTPNKPGPAHIVFAFGEKVYAEALVQPNLEIPGR